MVAKWKSQWSPAHWSQAQQADANQWRGTGSQVQDAQADHCDNQRAASGPPADSRVKEQLGDARPGRPQSIQPSPDQPVQPVPQDQPVPQVQPAPGLHMEPCSVRSLVFSDDECMEEDGHTKHGLIAISTDYGAASTTAIPVPMEPAHVTPAPTATPVPMVPAQAQAQALAAAPAPAQAPASAPALAPAPGTGTGARGTEFGSHLACMG